MKKKMRRSSKYLSVKLLIESFMLLILIGTVLLLMPFSTDKAALSFIDSLFTATSAVCVTGLTVVNTGDFTFWGQLIILMLIQLGGLGIMAFATFFVILLSKRMSLSERLIFRDILPELTVKSVFALLRHIFLFTLLVEFLGVLVLVFFVFNDFTHLGNAVWYACFHSISAFCNAGFSLYPDSFTTFRSHSALNGTMIGLIVIGGIGFVVYEEIYQKMKKRIKRKERVRLSVHSKIVILTSVLLILGGACLFFALEYYNACEKMPIGEKILTAVFQSVTTRTAGFNTVTVADLSIPTIMVMMIWMFIGGAPASCAGGIKVTTFALIACLVVAGLKGKEHVTVFKRRISNEIITKALSLFFISALLVMMAVYGVALLEKAGDSFRDVRGSFLEIVFECISAFGTVGLSMGITGALSFLSKWIIVLLMFVGRLGPLTLGILITAQRKEEPYEYPEENVIIG
ncbi:MAG: TrkH family potassium uptake protein [Candidatus Omnitrophica bacterium]|nr:TrkH family potassium uptake protein [Candidatus Omnitrophota bacterium]